MKRFRALVELLPGGKARRYIGGDIVKDLVTANEQRHGDATTRFVHLDIVHDPLPPADLWLCRDCLPHLSYELVGRAVKHFLASDIGYLLSTVHPDATESRNIPTGNFRLLNLELEPFGFPPPRLRIDNTSAGLDRKELVLWSRDTLREALASNALFA